MDFRLVLDNLSELILAIIASGGGAAIVAYQLFKSFGASWLEGKFESRMEAFRHENAKELQAVRASVDGALSKTVRSQEKEFDVLSKLWSLGNIALGEVGSFVSPLQSYSDVSKMSDEMLVEHLEQYNLAKSENDEIRNASDKMGRFIEAIFWHKRNKANRALSEFRNQVFLNEVFVEAPIAEEFKWISKELNSALVDKELSREDGERALGREAYKKLNEEITPRLEALASIIRGKFFERV